MIKEQTINASTENNNDTNDYDVDDWCENRTVDEMDTLIQEPDMTEHGGDILSVAPGEGLDVASR